MMKVTPAYGIKQLLSKFDSTYWYSLIFAGVCSEDDAAVTFHQDATIRQTIKGISTFRTHPSKD